MNTPGSKITSHSALTAKQRDYSSRILSTVASEKKYPLIKLCPDGFVGTNVDTPKWGHNPSHKLILHYDEAYGGKHPTSVTLVYVTKKDRAATVKTGRK
jgi:hypothetical protein